MQTNNSITRITKAVSSFPTGRDFNLLFRFLRRRFQVLRKVLARKKLTSSSTEEVQLHEIHKSIEIHYPPVQRASGSHETISHFLLGLHNQRERGVEAILAAHLRPSFIVRWSGNSARRYNEGGIDRNTPAPLTNPPVSNEYIISASRMGRRGGPNWTTVRVRKGRESARVDRRRRRRSRGNSWQVVETKIRRMISGVVSPLAPEHLARGIESDIGGGNARIKEKRARCENFTRSLARRVPG